MTAREMWDLYSQKENITDAFDAWAFGDDADELARLVNAGIKTATASAGPLYDLDGEALPQIGQYSVILDSRGEAVCVIRTTRVFVAPFSQVDATHAYWEGEGDRSLVYWRQVHERFFSAEMKAAGLRFREDMPVVCEEFRKVFP